MEFYQVIGSMIFLITCAQWHTKLNLTLSCEGRIITIEDPVCERRLRPFTWVQPQVVSPASNSEMS